MTLFQKSPSNILKFRRDWEFEKNVDGIRDFEQNMCGKAGFEHPIVDPHYLLYRKGAIIRKRGTHGD